MSLDIEYLKKICKVYPSPWDAKRLYLPRVTTAQALTLPDEIMDLRNYVPQPYPDQGQIGSCVGWAWANWMYTTNALLDKTTNHELFSAWDTYNKARKYDDLPDILGEGSTILAGAKALQKEGVCYESCMPTPKTQPLLPITPCAQYSNQLYGIEQYFQINRNPADLKAAIAGQVSLPSWGGVSPIVIGIYVYESITQVGSDGIIPIPKSGERQLGGHALAAAAYKKVGDITYLGGPNSWGPDWGDHGWYWLPIEDPHNVLNNYLSYIMDAWVGHNKIDPLVPPQPSPSTCIFGNGAAKVLSQVPRVLKRKGRFYYMNPP
jgi:hypothetical protein